MGGGGGQKERAHKLLYSGRRGRGRASWPTKMGGIPRAHTHNVSVVEDDKGPRLTGHTRRVVRGGGGEWEGEVGKRADSGCGAGAGLPNLPPPLPDIHDPPSKTHLPAGTFCITPVTFNFEFKPKVSSWLAVLLHTSGFSQAPRLVPNESSPHPVS